MLSTRKSLNSSEKFLTLSVLFVRNSWLRIRIRPWILKRLHCSKSIYFLKTLTFMGCSNIGFSLASSLSFFFCKFRSALTKLIALQNLANQRKILKIVKFVVTFNPGAHFSKVPKTFRARKAIPKTATRLFCKAGLFICCKGNKN